MKSVIKRILGNRTVTRLAAARRSDSVVILGYHDIGPDAGPRSWLRVRQGELDRQLAWLCSFGRFIDPDRLPISNLRAEGSSGHQGGSPCSRGGDATSALKPVG